jgi:hypothetical protein
MFARPRAYLFKEKGTVRSSTRVDPGLTQKLKLDRCPTLKQAPVLSHKIRLGWKCLPEKNTLTYYEHS